MNLCSICSGSSGNCIYVGDTNTHIMVDAGASGKKMESGMNELDLSIKDVNAILITHEHSDHIKGLGVVSRKYGVPIYATAGTIEAVKGNKAMGKIPEELFHEIKADSPFWVNDIVVKPFEISHDAAEPVGYRFEKGDSAIGIATDLGEYTNYTIDKLSGLDVLLLEANHDVRMLQVGAYPYYLKQRILGRRGHLSNESSGQLLSKILHDGLKTVLLGHLSRENNYEELAYETVRLEITMADNKYKPDDFPIYVAGRDSNSMLVTA